MRAAQVLLTASDIAARTNYLNARQTLRRLLEWEVVPVVNENDTTATDEISFGDNDFLAAQVAILLDARLLVLLTDIDGLHTADPRPTPTAELVEEVTDFAELRGLRDRRPHLALRLGRDAQQGRGGGDGQRGRDRGGDLRRDRARHPRRPRPRASRSAPASRPTRPRRSSFKLWLATESRRAGASSSTRAPPGSCASSGCSLLPVGITAVEGSFEAGDAVEVVVDGEVVGKGICNYSADEMRRIKGLKSAEVRELMPHAAEEAVHRDYFVLAGVGRPRLPFAAMATTTVTTRRRELRRREGGVAPRSPPPPRRPRTPPCADRRAAGERTCRDPRGERRRPRRRARGRAHRRAARPAHARRGPGAAMADGVGEIVALPDPVGEEIEARTLASGIELRRVRVPLGVVAVVYEARPNVTIDCAALTIKSGNAIVLRGSSYAERSNGALAAIVREALADAGPARGRGRDPARRRPRATCSSWRPRTTSSTC